MANATIIDALFCIPLKASVMQLSDCVQFNQDLAPQMNEGGIAGVVLAHCNCWQCQHHWNCADRRTHEIVNVVAKNKRQVRGLASYDPLRIGESLRWIDDAVWKAEWPAATPMRSAVPPGWTPPACIRCTVFAPCCVCRWCWAFTALSAGQTACRRWKLWLRIFPSLIFCWLRRREPTAIAFCS